MASLFTLLTMEMSSLFGLLWSASVAKIIENQLIRLNNLF
jgi:hypothetical protein